MRWLFIFRHWCWLLCYVVLSFVFIEKALANALPMETNLNDTYKTTVIQPVIEILEDKTGLLSFDEIQVAQRQSRFEPVHSLRQNFGYTDSTYWLRFQVKRQGFLPWFIRVNTRYESNIKVYCVPVETNEPVYVEDTFLGGYQVPTFALEIPADEDWLVYIRINNYYAPLVFMIELVPQQVAALDLQYERLVYGLVMGAMLALAAYNLFLVFSFSDTSYLTLIFCMMALTLELASYNGTLYWLIQDHERYVFFGLFLFCLLL